MLTYQWSTGATTEQIWVKQEGKYKVDVTMNGGVCGSDSTVVLFFDGITGGEQFICLGDSLPLALDQRCYNMQWSTGDTSLQIKIKPGINENIFASFLFGSKLFSDTIQARVNANPPGELQFSKSKLCSNDSIALKAPEGNYKYTWFRNDSLLNDTAAGIVIRFPQQIEVVVTDTNGCKTKSEKLIVTLAELPRTKIILLSDSFQCENDNRFVFKDLTQLANGTYNTNWDFETDDFSLDSLPECHYTGSNVFWVKLWVTTENGCMAIDSQKVLVAANPNVEIIGDFAISRNGNANEKETHTYTATISALSKYNWNLTYGYILSGAGTMKIDVIWANMKKRWGSIQLVVTDPNGCIDSVEEIVSFYISGLEEQSHLSGMVLSPNPNHGTFQLKFKYPSNEGFSIAICDLTGKEQWSSVISDSFIQNDFKVKTHLNPGMYTVHVHQGSQHWVEKMVVE
ncbi:MAG: T9SS type A sorting domain-containing protein [Bacteroidia bacterium]